MSDMMPVKSLSLTDPPHSARNKCKLIWDSTTVHRYKAQALLKTKDWFIYGPIEHVTNRNPDIRTSLVASRISFYEEKKKKREETKGAQVKISFADHATTTFEYEGEELALENYLVEHPEERDEVLKQEQELESSGLSQKPDDLLHDSLHALQDSESHMKSNTVLGLNAGALTSYKSKMQTQEFQFGVHTELDINFNEAEVDLDQPELESFHFLPTEDNEADTFSSEADKLDMLF